MRSPAVLACAGVLVLGCGPKPEDDAKTDDAKAKAAETKADPDADDPKQDEEQASFAKPKAEPPPAPEGALTLADPWMYVQTCAEPHPCPKLTQPAGDAHCRELILGGHDIWRLPSKDEVSRFAGVEGLDETAGYHWTRTPYEEDLGQVWIVDPQGAGQPTTIPRERKPFLIRCVKEP